MISAGPSDVGMTSSLPAVQVLHRQPYLVQLVVHGAQRVAHGGDLHQAGSQRLGPIRDPSRHERKHHGSAGDDGRGQHPHGVENQRHRQRLVDHAG
jgi:hypothetical protein